MVLLRGSCAQALPGPLGNTQIWGVRMLGTEMLRVSPTPRWWRPTGSRRFTLCIKCVEVVTSSPGPFLWINAETWLQSPFVNIWKKLTCVHLPSLKKMNVWWSCAHRKGKMVRTICTGRPHNGARGLPSFQRGQVTPTDSPFCFGGKRHGLYFAMSSQQ